jgi:uncharacterized membrane protein YvbJ
LYIYPLIKIQEEKRAMFWRKKQIAWYWKVLTILVILRIIYAFAKFFMKATARHAGISEACVNNDK